MSRVESYRRFRRERLLQDCTLQCGRSRQSDFVNCMIRRGPNGRYKPVLDDRPTPMADGEPRFKAQHRHHLVHRPSVASSCRPDGLAERLLTHIASLACGCCRAGLAMGPVIVHWSRRGRPSEIADRSTQPRTTSASEPSRLTKHSIAGSSQSTSSSTSPPMRRQLGSPNALAASHSWRSVDSRDARAGHQQHTLCNYGARSVIIGSRRDARMAGAITASAIVTTSNSVAPMSVSGSI